MSQSLEGTSAFTAYSGNYSAWSASIMQSEHGKARNMNTSIALTAAAALWTFVIPQAALATNSTQNKASQPAIISQAPSYSQLKDERSQLISMVREFQSLEPEWDGGADDVAPSLETVYQASQYIEKIPSFIPLPDVSVASDGEVIVFWRDENLYIDVSFRGSNNFVFFANKNGKKHKGSEPFESMFSSSDQLATLLIEAYSSNEMHV